MHLLIEGRSRPAAKPAKKKKGTDWTLPECVEYRHHEKEPKYFCLICQISMSYCSLMVDSHIQGQKHQKKVKGGEAVVAFDLNALPEMEHPNFEVDGGGTIICLLCQQVCHQPDAHILTRKHAMKMIRRDMTNSFLPVVNFLLGPDQAVYLRTDIDNKTLGAIYQCTICLLFIQRIEDILPHFRSAKHLKFVDHATSPVEVDSRVTYVPPPYLVTAYETFFKIKLVPPAVRYIRGPEGLEIEGETKDSTFEGSESATGVGEKGKPSTDQKGAPEESADSNALLTAISQNVREINKRGYQYWTDLHGHKKEPQSQWDIEALGSPWNPKNFRNLQELATNSYDPYISYNRNVEARINQNLIGGSSHQFAYDSDDSRNSQLAEDVLEETDDDIVYETTSPAQNPCKPLINGARPRLLKLSVFLPRTSYAYQPPVRDLSDILVDDEASENWPSAPSDFDPNWLFQDWHEKLLCPNQADFPFFYEGEAGAGVPSSPQDIPEKVYFRCDENGQLIPKTGQVFGDAQEDVFGNSSFSFPQWPKLSRRLPKMRKTKSAASAPEKVHFQGHLKSDFQPETLKEKYPQLTPYWSYLFFGSADEWLEIDQQVKADEAAWYRVANPRPGWLPSNLVLLK